MEQRLTVTGMTCNGCAATVRKALAGHPSAKAVVVTLDPPEVVVSSGVAIPLVELNALLSGTHYAIAELTKMISAQPSSVTVPATKQSWFGTYYPLLLVFLFITGVSWLTSVVDGQVDLDRAMRHFMAGFFLVFSFFKLLDLQGFADSYAGYDLLASRVKAYGYVYPFMELALGIAYLLPEADPVLVNAATIAVMGFSTLGVLRAVLNKQQILCVCLGTGFNLPMSTVTIVEDLLMVAMAAAMLMVR